MAQVWTLTTVIEDAKGQQGRVVIYLEYERPLDVVDAISDPTYFSEAFVEALDGIIEGKIVSSTLSTPIVLPVTIKAVAEENSDVEDGAIMVFRAANGESFQHRIPTIRQDYYGADEETVDEDLLIGAGEYWTLMVLAIEAPEEWQIRATEARGVFLNSFKYGKKRFQPSRKV